jgi:hypothetical protein|nr:MAG TPA: hypothetical protein [Caudoviricetes sp.]
MGLNKEQLKQGIISLQRDMLTKTESSMEEYAERLASLIDTFVRSGEVTVQAGITLQAGAYTGATTSTGTGAIS